MLPMQEFQKWRYIIKMKHKNFTKLFSNIEEKDRFMVGGKGYSLSLLARLNVNVPNGFVVMTPSYETYLKTNGISELNTHAKQKILDGSFPVNIELEIQSQVANLKGRFFAVRSSSVSEDSADKSFAGMFDSFLNVEADGIIEAIKKCYISTLSQHVLHYRHQEEPIAVVVQEMVKSKVSGVLFTNHPLSGEKDVVVIESCPGLGELLVSGVITPDFYVVDKATGTILEKQIRQHKQKLIYQDGENKTIPIDGSELKLNASHIRNLVACANQIEQFYGFSCDIEWCIDDDIFIVQSRPITTIASDKQVASSHLYNKRFFSRILSPVFEEANVKGYSKYAQEQFELPFNLKGYHLYQPSVLHPKGEVDIWINTDLDKKLKSFIKKNTYQDISYLKRIESLYLDLTDKFTEFALTIEQTNFQNSPTPFILEKLQEFDILNQKMTSIYNAPIFVLGALGEILLEEMIAIDENTADADFVTLTLSCIQNPVLQRDLDLNRIYNTAKIKYAYKTWSTQVAEEPEIKKLLQQYEHRWKFLACTDVMGEAFTFEYFVNLLKEQYTKDPYVEYQSMIDQTQTEYQDFTKVAKKYSRLSYEITWMRKWLYHRNNTTEHYYRDFQHLKPLWLSVSQKLDISYRNLLNLSVEEMIDGILQKNNNVQKEAEARNIQGFTCEEKEEKIILKTGINYDERLEKEILNKDEMQGQIANTGLVEGRVRIIRDPIEEAHTFTENDILVTSMTTPSFLSLMEKSSGIITDEGGILCHAALVSREIGKPCLIGVTNATQILDDGDIVRVDCNNGFVKILVKS